MREQEEMQEEAGEDIPDVAAEEGGGGIEDGAEDAGAEEAGETREKKLPEDAPEWAIKEITRLRADRREARERKAAAEAELEEAKAEAAKLNAKFGDREVLEAAKRVGFAAELMTAEEVKLVDRAQTLETRLERLEDTLEDHPEGYEDGEGKAVTPVMLHQWIRKTRRDLKEIEEDAAVTRKQKAAEAREIWRLGLAARKAKWQPGRKAEAPVKAKVAQAQAAAAAGGQRRAVAQAAAKGGADFSKVKTRDELVAEMAKEYGG